MTVTSNPTPEVLDLVNENDEIIGEVEKTVANSNPKLLHREVGILIFNSENKILLQQRSFKKKVGPGLWIISVAGHVIKGMTYEETAHKELQEELGFDTKLVYIYKKMHHFPNETFFSAFFIGHHSGETMIFDQEEINEARFFSKNEFDEKFSTNENIEIGSANAIRDFWANKFQTQIKTLS